MNLAQKTSQTNIINRADGVFTTFYLHPAGRGQLLYEKEVKPNVTEHKHYLTAGSLLIGVHISRSDTTTETRYFHHDHLGSLTLITNAAGGQIERLDEIALIHMNGRVYDPLLARFMTADPQVQFAGNLQSYNRYSYVNNNPLAYTDPSGYGLLSSIGHALSSAWKSVWHSGIGRAAVTIAVAYFTGYYNFGTVAAPSYGILGTAELGLGNALVGGFAGGATSTGTLEGGLKGAFSGALFFGVGEFVPGAEGSWTKVLGHAVAGCVSSAASDGDCRSGAMAAGFSQAAAPYVPGDPRSISQLVGRTVIGGTASALGGGKFANGAVTGASPGCFD